MALLAFVQFTVAVDFNIVFVALPDLGAALKFGASSLQWVVSAYAVTFGGLLLLGGRTVDRFGPRRVLVAGLTLFGLSCLAAGLAPGAGVLVAARAVQGVGAALLSPATLAAITQRFDEGPARARALALWGAAGSGGLAVGALAGGVLTRLLGWEWVFFVLVPMALAAAVAAVRLLPPDPRPRHGAGGLDVPGALLVTAGSTLVVLGLVGGPDAGWFSARGLGALGAGVVLLALTPVVESRVRTPLVPLAVLTRRDFVVTVVVILLFQSSLAGAYFLVTTFLQDVHGYDALQAGLTFVPLTVVSMAASLRALGPLLTRLGLRRTLLAGMVVNGAGLLLLAAAATSGTSFAALLPGLVVWGVGGGITFPAMFVAAASGVRPEEAGVASALATTAQQIGGAAGLAVLVGIATTNASLVDGLRLALGLAGAASVAGGVLVLALRLRPAPVAEPGDSAAAADHAAPARTGGTRPGSAG